MPGRLIIFVIVLSLLGCSPNEDRYFDINKEGGIQMELLIHPRDVITGLTPYNPFNDANLSPVFQYADSLFANGDDYFDVFEEAARSYDQEKKLGFLFHAGSEILFPDPNISLNELINELREYYTTALERARNVFSSRLLKVTASNFVVEVIDTGLLISIQSIQDERRIYYALRGPGRVDFYETYQNYETISYLREADSLISQYLYPELWDSTGFTGMGEPTKENPVLSRIQFNITKEDNGFTYFNPGGLIGYIAVEDTAMLFTYLRHHHYLENPPNDLKFALGAKSINGFVPFFALRTTTEGKPALPAPRFTDVNFKEVYSNYEVTMCMDLENAELWGKLTRKLATQNPQGCVAIVLDGSVLTAPTVTSEISSGISNISGGFDYDEAMSLAATLNSGALPYPITVISEKEIAPK